MRPVQAAPVDGDDRVLVSLIGFGTGATGLFLAYDGGGSLLVQQVWPWLSPALLIAAAVLCLAWALAPASRTLYALSGAVAATAYLTRSALAWFTLQDGSSPFPWSVAVGGTAWLVMTVFVVLAWRRMEPAWRKGER